MKSMPKMMGKSKAPVMTAGAGGGAGRLQKAGMPVPKNGKGK